MIVMGCDDADQLLALSSLGALEEADRNPLTDHLRGCAACRQSAVIYNGTTELLPLALTELEPSPGLRTRIMGEVYGRRPARVSVFRRAWERVPAGRGFTFGGSLVLAAAVAIAAVGVRRSPAPVTQPPSTTAAYSVAVAGSPATPQVRGVMRYAPSTGEAVLTVDGLPPQPGGSYDKVYEVWLTRSGSAPVPVAFLTPTPDQTHWVAAIKLASIADYQTVAATVEPRGGSVTPSSQAVLAGDLRSASPVPAPGS